MLYTLHYITDLFHICKIQWNLIKDEMRSEYCNSNKWYINIHSSLMYSGVKIIFSSPDIQTIIQLQLCEIQTLSVHNINFIKQHHNFVT